MKIKSSVHKIKLKLYSISCLKWRSGYQRFNLAAYLKGRILYNSAVESYLSVKKIFLKKKTHLSITLNEIELNSISSFNCKSLVSSVDLWSLTSARQQFQPIKTCFKSMLARSLFFTPPFACSQSTSRLIWHSAVLFLIRRNRIF